MAITIDQCLVALGNWNFCKLNNELFHISITSFQWLISQNLLKKTQNKTEKTNILIKRS